MEKCDGLEDIQEMKKEYAKLKQKYELPDFDSLAEDFDIEKACEKPNTFLLRDIRKAIGEKISAYFHLFENFLNPSNSSLFIFSLLKGVEEIDRDKIKKIYKRIGKLQIPSMKADTIYSEQAEADYLKLVYSEWQELKQDIFKILDRFESNFDIENNHVSKGYFG